MAREAAHGRRGLHEAQGCSLGRPLSRTSMPELSSTCRGATPVHSRLSPDADQLP